MALLIKMLLKQLLVIIKSQLVAHTDNYAVTVMEDSDGLFYGITNKMTDVIEIKENIFSNAVAYMMDIQATYNEIHKMLDKDKYVSLDKPIKVTSHKGGLHCIFLTSFLFLSIGKKRKKQC